MEQPKKPNRTLIIVIVAVGGLFLACSACVVMGALGGKGTPTPGAVMDSAAAARPGETAVRQAEATAGPPTAPRPTATPTPRPVGLSRDNPAPVGVAVEADDHLVFTVKGMKRGAEAWAEIHNDNMFNSEPNEGMEYVLITLEAVFAGDASQTKNVSSSYFRIVGDRGVIYTSPIMMVLQPSIDMELFGGGKGTGKLAFQVAKGEESLVLIYSGLGIKARYLAVGG